MDRTRIGIKVREIVAELDYAQRRLLDIRVGSDFDRPRQSGRRTRRELVDVERSWSSDLN